MAFFEERILTESTEIAAAPEAVWAFFHDIERNYQAWHPEDHIVCRWIRGKPHRVGSILYAEEVLAGRLCKIKMVCTHVEPHRAVAYRTLFPLGIFHPWSEYLFEPRQGGTHFTAVNRFRIPTTLFRGRIESLVQATERHIREEGERLRDLLAGKRGLLDPAENQL